MKAVNVALVVLTVVVVFVLSACGGNSSNAAATTQAPPATVAPAFVVTTTSLPPALVGTPYSVQLTAANGTAPYTWTSSAWVASGLTLSGSGLISGTPKSPLCDTTLAVTVTDSSNPPKMASANLPYDAAGIYTDLRQGQVTVFYDNVMQFECSTAPVSWSLVSGSVPPGLQMNPFSAGSSQLNFYGTPTQSGTYNITVKAQDAISRTAQQTASIVILPAPLKITDTLMHLGVVNKPFDHVVPATGGTPPYTFVTSAGALATGLQLNAGTGEISGTPTTAGYYQFNIKVTDTTTPTPFTFEKPYTMLVTPAALPPRNDTLADATPIFPGTYIASLSPYTDSAGNAAPDQDYYVLTGNGGDVYQIGAGANYELLPAVNDPGPATSSVDIAIEILDSTGARMTTCNDPVADNPPPNAPFPKSAGNYTDTCMDHGGYGGGSDASVLTLQLPPGTNQSFYIHVFDFEGRARPDFIYSLTVTKQ